MCAMNPRLLRPLASGFNPRSIAGIDLWMDAADGSTLFQNSDGTTPATATSDPVGYWGDKSGNNRHATQATAGNRPTISATTQNGRRTLGFNGTSHVLASFTSALQPSSIFAVANCTSSGNFPLGNAILASDTTNHPLAWIENGRWELVRWGQNMSGPIAADGTTNILSATNDGTTSTLFVNGGGAVTNAGGTFSSGALTIGAATDTQYFGGRIAELLVYGRALTTAERQKIEGYLAWKWGLQSQLPYDHPYAKSFPGFGSQTVPTDADTLTYLAAVKAADGTGVEVGVANAVDAFVTGCKSDGIWDSIKASCILAGARSLAGALVPLKPLGPELWSVSTPSIVNFGGSIGVWDGSTRTMSNSVIGTNVGYPRFQFSLPLTIGKRYAVSGTLTGDTSAINNIRLSSLPGASNVSYNSATGAFSASNVPAAAALLEVTTNGTLAYSVSIADLSIRETSAPTNNNFAEVDYNRETGLVGDGSTTYLDANRADNADPQNDYHQSAYITEEGTSGGSTTPGFYLGTGSSTTSTLGRFNGQLYARNRVNSLYLSSFAAGLFGSSRSLGASYIERLGATSTTRANSSSATSSNPTFIFGRSSSGGLVELYSDGRIAFYSIGESLDLAALDARVTALITAIGAAI